LLDVLPKYVIEWYSSYLKFIFAYSIPWSIRQTITGSLRPLHYCPLNYYVEVQVDDIFEVVFCYLNQSAMVLFY
ncbi:MAG: hypothetical protein AAFZ92_10225, partial [Pseudomonadota bacterium]